MPKVKYLGTIPPPDMLQALLKHYQKSRKLTSADVGKALGKSSEAVRGKLHRNTDTWTVADVRQWCEALGITSAEELGRAILRR
jgi:hypothetical protein